MGCVKSSRTNEDQARANRVRKPRPWRHCNPISADELVEARNLFWRNAPRHGGRPEIWDALRAAAQSDLPYAQAIINNNSIRLENADMTVCYDENGTRYELPLYVLSEPTNMTGVIHRPTTVNRPNFIEHLLRRR